MSTLLPPSGIARLKLSQKSLFHRFTGPVVLLASPIAEQGAWGWGLTELRLTTLKRNIQVLQEAVYAVKELLRQIFIIWFKQILHKSKHVYPKTLNQSEEWVTTRKSQRQLRIHPENSLGCLIKLFFSYLALSIVPYGRKIIFFREMFKIV